MMSIIRQSVFAVLVLLFGIKGYAIPIIAYGGVSPKYATAERFLELRNAGFDVCITNFGDLPTSKFIKVLDIAKQCDVKLFALSTELWENPQSTIALIKKHPALYGYYVYDEPAPNQIKQMTDRFLQMMAADSTKAFYLNLIPYYDEATLRMSGIKDYEAYVKQCVKIGVPQICFDYYPITESGIRSKWYHNLELIRKESLLNHRPFWAFALSTPHADYPMPTLAMLRLQMYTNLAYGATALLYFTYGTPQRTKDFVFHDGPISVDGHRTPTYETVRQMNNELRPLLPLFEKAQVTSVRHLGKNTPEGATRMTKTPSHVSRLVVYGSQGVLVSQMKTEKGEYMVVVNKDYRKSIRIRIKADASVVEIDKRLQSKPLQEEYRLPGGDILLFRL